MKNELDATTHAVIAADAAHLAHLADGAGWERRGLLRRLARTNHPAGESVQNAPRRN